MELELEQPLQAEPYKRWQRSAVIAPVDDGTFVVLCDGELNEIGVTHERALSVRSSLLYDQWEIL